MEWPLREPWGGGRAGCGSCVGRMDSWTVFLPLVLQDIVPFGGATQKCGRFVPKVEAEDVEVPGRQSTNELREITVPKKTHTQLIMQLIFVVINF